MSTIQETLNLMTALYYAVFLVYTLALIYITIYCLLQFHLLYYYQKERFSRNGQAQPIPAPADHWPFVTVQLPIYNELYVAERLIDNILQFDYPKDRFEVHVLDDSTDETVEITRRKVAQYQALGFQIEHITREKRTGFKAGALKEAMPRARGEFIAIFDADFLPRADFLRVTLPYFSDPQVGVVQTRWEHINEDYSLITRLQALHLNVHFTIEQQGRQAGRCMLQFNGTAGVWRRKTIDDAGGWEADTLTEDLDLSIRAQLKGWKIRYLENIGSPAELPAEMNGLKSQQFRWMKGGAETARKMLPTIWRSQLNFRQKVHATGQLAASSIFIFIFLAGLFSVPLLFIQPKLNISMGFFTYFLVGWLAIIAIYYVANVQAEMHRPNRLRQLLKFLLLFPLFLALSMGLSLHNTIAVIQGYLGRKSPFVRTPKFDIKGVTDSFRKQQYLASNLSWTTIFEGLLTLYFLIAVIIGWYMANTTFLIFHSLLVCGYGTIVYYSIRHLRPKS